MTSSFLLSEGTGFCNAVRRTLLHDVSTWAPKELFIRTNTSCQTDEFLAHRVGLVPFRREGHGNGSVTLSARGPCTVTSGEFRGGDFESVHDNIEIMLLGDGQELDLDVHFDRRAPSSHTRYSPCAAVGMCRVDEKRHRISFECIGGEAPKETLIRALEHLEGRIDRALHSIANQPTSPPQTMC